jgi:hypothetical protein
LPSAFSASLRFWCGFRRQKYIFNTVQNYKEIERLCSSESDRRKIIHWKLAILIKGKAIPLEAWTGPEDSRRLRLPNFKTIGT